MLQKVAIHNFYSNQCIIYSHETSHQLLRHFHQEVLFIDTEDVIKFITIRLAL